MRKLEAVFAVLISTMGLSFAWMFADTEPSGKELLIGTDVNSTYFQVVLFVLVVFPHGLHIRESLYLQVFWCQNLVREQ